jgi:predicted TPR repeat methyltransferase
VEAADAAGWELTPNNRFCHSEQYLRAEAAACQLDVIALEPCTIRDEHTAPVAGFAVLLRPSR